MTMWPVMQFHICYRPYNNFIVRCRIPNFHYHSNKRHSMANFSDTVRYIICPQRPTVWCKILHYTSFYKPSCSQFSLNIPKFSLPWQQGSVWYILMTPLNCLTLKTQFATRIRLYLLCKPSYSYFLCQNSLPWQQGSTLRYILMSPLNCLTSKTPCLVQESRLYLFCKPSYSYHGNKGRSEVNFSTTIRLSDHDFPKRVGYFGNQKSFCVILDEFITWALTKLEVACTPNQQSMSGFVEKVHRYVQSSC